MGCCGLMLVVVWVSDFGGFGFRDPFLGFTGCGLPVGHEVLVRLWMVLSGCWWFSVGF